MTRTIDAIFSNGVLTPTEPLPLREHERVRITLETVERNGDSRDAAVRRMSDGFGKLLLRTGGRLPAREDLHERG